MTKIDEKTIDPQIIEVARTAYKAYAKNSDGKTFDGRDMPTWEKLTSLVRSHWCAAILAALNDARDRIHAGANAELAKLQENVTELRAKLEAVESGRTPRTVQVTSADPATSSAGATAAAVVAAQTAVGEKASVPINIVVNGIAMETRRDVVTYEEVVSLAGKTGTPSVTFMAKRRDGTKMEGTMHTGSPSLQLKEGTVFNVISTGAA